MPSAIRVLSPWPQGVLLKTHLNSGRDGYWLDVWGSCSIYEKQEAKRGGCMIPWYPVKELLRRFGSSSGREFFFGIWMNLCDGFGSVPWRMGREVVWTR